MAKVLATVMALVFGLTFSGLGLVQAKDMAAEKPSSPMAEEKTMEEHGKAGENHGKAGEDHGKAGEKQGKSVDKAQKKVPAKKKKAS
jgi:hypothetical protein